MVFRHGNGDFLFNAHIPCGYYLLDLTTRFFFFIQLTMHKIMNLIPRRMEWGGGLEVATDSTFCNSRSSAKSTDNWHKTTSPSMIPVCKRVESARLNARDEARMELFHENWGLKLWNWVALTERGFFSKAMLQHGDLLGEVVHGCAWEWSPHMHVVNTWQSFLFRTSFRWAQTWISKWWPKR